MDDIVKRDVLSHINEFRDFMNNRERRGCIPIDMLNTYRVNNDLDDAVKIIKEGLIDNVYGMTLCRAFDNAKYEDDRKKFCPNPTRGDEDAIIHAYNNVSDVCQHIQREGSYQRNRERARAEYEERWRMQDEKRKAAEDERNLLISWVGRYGESPDYSKFSSDSINTKNITEAFAKSGTCVEVRAGDIDKLNEALRPKVPVNTASTGISESDFAKVNVQSMPAMSAEVASKTDDMSL